MKFTSINRYRRSASRSRESSMLKKDVQQEHAFFAAPSNESFFKPNASLQRKCAACEADDKQVNCVATSPEDKELNRIAAGSEEEKKVRKAEGKEEEKKVHFKSETEEEKVQRAPGAGKGEEKRVQKMDEKKEEKPMRLKPQVEEKDKKVQRTAGKEEEKKISRTADLKGQTELAWAADNKEEDKKLAKKEASASNVNSSFVSNYIQSLDGKGAPLPDEVIHFFCERMGYDFSDVRIHTGPEAEQSAKEVNARAYTVDKHIVFNKGEYNPSSEESKKLLAHELTHVVQNRGGVAIDRKSESSKKKEEEPVIIEGSADNTKKKSSFGNCQAVQVNGRTDFTTLPSSFRVQGAVNRTSTACEDCTPPNCITSRGTIVSTFRSNINVTLPAVPSGLSPCEAAAVRRFINTTLRAHEQEHVTAFRTYNGTVRTPYTYEGCRNGLRDHIRTIHQDLDAQRATDAMAQSDALDPFNVIIPCNCY